MIILTRYDGNTHMQYFVTNNLKEFKCIADKCPDTCCAGWLIEIDEASLEKYSSVEGDYRRVLEERIDRSENVFRQKTNGECSFLCENKLCDMYSVLGENALCDTCRLYPRHIEEFENVREMTLSISCPEAARLLMKRTEPVMFVESGGEEFSSPEESKGQKCEELAVKESCKDSEEVFDDFDNLLYEKLLSVREDMLKILRDRSHSYAFRAKRVADMAVGLQNELDGMESDDEPQTESVYELSKSLFMCLYELEHLKGNREEELRKAEKILFAGGEEYWNSERKAFEVYCMEQGNNPDIMREQLAAYYISAYFCGAVYDDYVFAKAFGAVAHTLLIENMWLAKWIELGHKCSEEDIVRCVYEYARELENSNPNLIKMDEMLDEYNR